MLGVSQLSPAGPAVQGQVGSVPKCGGVGSGWDLSEGFTEEGAALVERAEKKRAFPAVGLISVEA